jgi:hypothetical protein
MGPATPFAQTPATPEPIIAQVRRQLADDPVLGTPLEPTLLDRVADRAVRELWESRVKTFVPVLALRQAREILRDHEGEIRIERPEPHGVRRTHLADPPRGESPKQDGLHIAADVLPLDERDVLPL